MLMETDGAQNEVPCLLDLDVLLHGVNAAGLSLFNTFERRMTPLSRDLAGIVLPHDYFGNHLDSSEKTIKVIDQKLDVENFKKATDVLSQVWEKTVINGYLVHRRAVPFGKAYKPPNPDPVWVEKHCQQSRCCLQIVKCQDKSCCSPFETNWLKIIPQSFISFPVIYEYCENGYKAMKPSRDFKNLFNHSTFAPLTQCLLLKKA